MLAWFDRLTTNGRQCSPRTEDSAHRERFVLTYARGCSISGGLQLAWLPQGCVAVLTLGVPTLTAGNIESLCYPLWLQLKIPVSIMGNKKRQAVSIRGAVMANGQWPVAGSR